jgi:hypothetical protein
MKIEMVSKDASVGKNGAKMQVVQDYSLPCLRTKLWRRYLWTKDQVGEETLNSNLPPKLGLVKRIIPTCFPNYLLENAWIKFVFPYALLPHHKGTKQNTIGVTKWANAKLLHHSTWP